jgi:murein DD-endopeptidase MepM/ murein hydrolase activator NlpD
MDKYFTIMIVPEKEKGVRSFRVPRLIFRAVLFFVVLSVALLGILTYDYWKILSQVYENKHLTIENRQLKEQIQLFQMKVNSLTKDIDRIQVFEQKLRTITGLKKIQTARDLPRDTDDESAGSITPNKQRIPDQSKNFPTFEHLKDFKNAEKYKNLEQLYEKKIASEFGLQESYSFTKEWNELTKQSFTLAHNFAEFDYKFEIIKSTVKDLEVSVHNLDQHILDKDSFLRSTPTLMPTKGWITSYYGPRISPTSKRLRMHEGLDIGARTGTAIVASADGRVVFAGAKPGFGKFVQIDHGYGVESFYAHAKKLHTKKGMTLKRGDLIAAIGNTGASTGPHLHYEIRVNGTPVDPMYYILDI